MNKEEWHVVFAPVRKGMGFLSYSLLDAVLNQGKSFSRKLLTDQKSDGEE